MATRYDVSASALAVHLKRRFSEIAEEYRNLNAPSLALPRIGRIEDFVEQLKVHGENGWAPSWQVGSSEPNHAWLTYLLAYRGWFPPEAGTKFPRTRALLDHPAIEGAAFSLMRPLSVLGSHAHSRLGGDLLTLHLGLDVEAGKSFLCVDGTFLEERSGEVVIFDGSRDHFAVNASVRDRAILYIEFDRSKQ